MLESIKSIDDLYPRYATTPLGRVRRFLLERSSLDYPGGRVSEFDVAQYLQLHDVPPGKIIETISILPEYFDVDEHERRISIPKQASFN
jgi:hypothetical protein